MTRNHAYIIVRLIAIICFTILFVFSALWIFSISYPFWIAALLVWMFYPLVKVFQDKWRLPKGLAVFIVLIISLAVVAGVVTGLVFLIIFGTRRMVELLPDWIQTATMNAQTFFNEKLLPLWQKFGQMLSDFSPEQQNTLQGGIAKFGTRLAESITEQAQSLAEGLTQLLVVIPTFIISFVFIFVAFYFIGKDWEKLLAGARNSLPNNIIDKFHEFKNILRTRVLGFIRAQFILMFIASFIVYIGISILGVEHRLTIAIIVGVAELLPYFGSGTILIPWFIYMFITGNIGMGVGLAIVYAVTFAVRQSIEPKILSTSMNISALAALISLFVGIKLFGVFGVFLGPLLLIVLIVFMDIGLVEELRRFILYGFKDKRHS
ncbi:MAG TPA: sporulation integral membrane protein YtvI [Bacillota bacterium]|nr:sporulation integral membrane protein YtvI [Bacillota bacterium]